jgi:phosphatidylinositol alpha-mannosyltransferase
MESKTLKVAMVHRDLPCVPDRGGVSYHVHYLANHLVERQHEVTIFSTDPKPRDAKYQVHQIQIAPSLRRSKLFQLQIWPVLVARQDYSAFDIIHAHGDSQFLRSNSTPVVRTFYGSALAEALSAGKLRRKISQLSMYPLEWLSGKTAAMPTAISHTTAEHFPFIDTIVPCGVDLKQFKPTKDKSPNPSILFVGMLESRKRGNLLVDVFKKQVKPVIRNAELWLVCPEHIQQDGVMCYGKVSLHELAELYRKAWIFCLPSSYEGFGIPYIEALAAGTPVIATSNKGANEVLAEGTYGIICGEPELGQTLIDTIHNNDLRRELANEGLRYVSRFSWDKIVPRYECIYNSLLSKKQCH